MDIDFVEENGDLKAAGALPAFRRSLGHRCPPAPLTSGSSSQEFRKNTINVSFVVQNPVDTAQKDR